MNLANTRQRGGIRWTLRDSTQNQHKAVESEFDRFDLTNPTGYRGFLSAHWLALLAVRSAFETHNPFGIDIPDLMRLIELDLKGLNGSPPRAIRMSAEPADPSGLTYVIAGSHLGAKVILQKVRKGHDPDLRKNTRYLENTHLSEVWNRFCQTDADLIQEERSHLITSGANTAFGLFAQAANTMADE